MEIPALMSHGFNASFWHGLLIYYLVYGPLCCCIWREKDAKKQRGPSREISTHKMKINDGRSEQTEPKWRLDCRNVSWPEEGMEDYKVMIKLLSQRYLSGVVTGTVERVSTVPAELMLGYIVNYVDSIISMRCSQVATVEYFDSDGLLLFTFIAGKGASVDKVVQGCPCSLIEIELYCTCTTR